jgi:hypothetical protein
MKKATSLLWLAVCLSLSGCGNIYIGPKIPPLVSTAAGANLGSIKLCFSPGSSNLDFERGPTSKFKASTSLALQGALAPIAAVASGGGGGAAAVLGTALLIPVTTIAGGTYGAIAGVGQNELDTATKAMATAKSDLQIRSDLTKSLQSKLSVSEDSSNEANSGPKPGEAAAIEPETTLTIHVFMCGLCGDPGLNPSLRLRLWVEAQLVRNSDGANAGVMFARYESAPNKFTQWAAENSKTLRAEWATAMASLTTQIVNWIHGDAIPAPFEAPTWESPPKDWPLQVAALGATEGGPDATPPSSR